MIDIKKIAQLANLSVSDAEISDLEKKLSETLNYIKILSKINTQKITSTSQVGNIFNHFREDKIDKDRLLPAGGPYQAKISWTN